MPRMATTIISSMRVKARRVCCWSMVFTLKGVVSVTGMRKSLAPLTNV
jgi:hypothetical protein